jgi:WD40 repeat protein/Flp pilus assembly protein TadD
MSEPTQMQSPPLGAARPLDPARRLASLWRQGQTPQVALFLAEAQVHDPAAIVTVLRVDQWERRRRGECVSVETYLDAFNEMRDDPELAIDLIWSEYLMREQLGESPSIEEYAGRFPEYVDQLKLQLELHRALDDDGGCEWPLGGSLSVIHPFASLKTDAVADTDPGPLEYPKIPGYEVLGILGRGGMGVVYRAWQHRLCRFVALKMLNAGALAGPQALSRFRIEAEVIAQLQHPNIVQIHEVGQHAGCPFLVLELLEGRSLAHSIGGTPQPIRFAAELVESLARAIHSAHCQGVVHRDLTPANILFTVTGTPRITDFGLAKLLKGGGGLCTQTGELLGTPSYMAPEQAAGRHEIGAATDVYALGAVLYDMLTGRPPFKAESALETLRQVMADPPVAPSRLRPRLPRDLETICMKCLRKEPAQRYASALALAEDLNRFQAGRPILARRSSAFERSARWCRRNPVVAGLLASIAILLVLLAGGSFGALLRVQQAERLATEKLWGAYLAQAQAGRWSGRVGRRFDSLLALAKAAALPTFPERRHQLRDEAIACMALVDLRVDKQLRALPRGSPGRPAVDPQLKRYVRYESQGSGSIRRIADDHEVFRFSLFQADEYSTSFSPDGRFVIVGTLPREPTNYQLWDLDRGQLASGLPHIATTFAFRGDSRQLALALPDGAVSLWDLPGIKLKRQWNAGGPIACLAFNPIQRQIALGLHGSSEIRICDLETGRVLRTLPNPSAVYYLEWRDDGQILAAACGDKVQVWDMTSGELLSVLVGHASGGLGMKFNHRGDLLASYGWDGSVRIWDPVSGREQLSFHGDFLGWGPDDQSLAYWLGTQVRIATLAKGAECWTLTHGLVGNRTPPRAIGPNSVEFNPDGRLLVSSGILGVRIYRAADGKELGLLPVGFCESTAFGRDGDLLTYNNQVGLARWPVKYENDATVRFGPPALLDLPRNSVGGNRRVAWDRQTGRVAVTDWGNGQAVLLDTASPGRRTLLRPHANIAEVAFSPDGRWLATGTWRGSNVKVWNTASGILAADLAATDSTVGFSPDGAWLVAGLGDAFRLYRTGSWQPGLIVPRDTGGLIRGAFAFRSDGRILAVAKMVQHDPLIQLIDPEIGRTIATLQARDLFATTWLAFSPDGGRLAVATANHCIQLWDLRLVRGQLKATGLDQGFPAEPGPDPAGMSAAPIEHVTVQGVDATTLRWSRARQVLREFGERFTELAATELPDAQAYHERAHRWEQFGQWKLAIADLDQAIRRSPKDLHLRDDRGMAHLRLNDYNQAIADLQQALEQDANHADACNLLAWIYLTGPAELRDPSRALVLVQRSVQSRPEERSYRNTLGVAFYRLGELEKAAFTLEQNVKTKHPYMAFDFVFLAMIRHGMGQHERARTELNRALEAERLLIQISPESATELQSLVIEARGVLREH